MKNHLLAVLTASLAASSPLMSADAKLSVEERLQRIEAQLERLEARLGEAVTADELSPALKELSDLKRNLDWDGKSQLVVVKPGGKENKLSLGGYVQIQGEAGDAPDSRFVGANDRLMVRRARITIKASFLEDFEFNLQSEFGNGSIAGVSGYRTQLADAYIAWRKYDFANIQVGQFKTPFGYEQLLPDTRVPTVERSLPNDMLTVGRQVGIGIQGSTADKKLTYSLGAFNGNGVNNGNNDNDHFMYAGRVAGQLWARGAYRLTLGANAFSSRDSGSLVGYRKGWGIDAQLALGRLDLMGEFLGQESDRMSGVDTTADGWSMTAAYFLIPKTLQGVLRYEAYDSNVDTGQSTTTGWIAGLNYLIKGDDIRLSVNYALGNPAGPLSDQGRLLGRLQLVF